MGQEKGERGKGLDNGEDERPEGVNYDGESRRRQGKDERVE